MKQLITVNMVKASAYQFLSTYKKVYNTEKKQELLRIANVSDIKNIGRYCITVSDVATAVANILEVDRDKVKTTLLNNTNTSMPTVKFNRKYGEYYYYLGDI